MKVIDLLNKIANGEEVPKKIKTEHDIWIYDDDDCEGIDYKASDDRGYMFEVHTRINKDDLNEEIEIIEENKKIKKITMRAGLVGSIENKLENLDINVMAVEDKINEIIDRINNAN